MRVRIREFSRGRANLLQTGLGSASTATIAEPQIPFSDWSQTQEERETEQDKPIRESQPPRLFLFWLGIIFLLAGSTTLSLLWLFRSPSLQCQAFSPFSAVGNRLYCAQQYAETGEPEKLFLALETITEVIGHPVLDAQAQQFLQDWSVEALVLAREKVESGDLAGGIKIANRVPLESRLYPDSQVAIALWQEEWQAGEELVRQFQSALNSQNWTAATELFRNLTKFDNHYWRSTRADELMFELSVAQGEKGNRKSKH